MEDHDAEAVEAASKMLVEVVLARPDWMEQVAETDGVLRPLLREIGRRAMVRISAIVITKIAPS